MVELKAISYEEARSEYLEEQMQKALRRMKYWESRIDRSRPDNLMDVAHGKASDAGWEYNFYKDALEALAAQPKWISVEERLPENLAVVLIYCNDDEVGVARYEDEYGCFVTTEKGTWKGAYGAVTHWMPLPQAPREEA